ncbi:MAG: PD-(D/E)XK nuclease-like domain-containing protein [Planctomycetaceae bacterium]|nr:PD-(D/E)XK nuclease-like domain-containing protein [Planctomycetaceae bacterium]
MLKEFRLCPAHYHAIVTGCVHPTTSRAYRLGKAAHMLVLEGESTVRKAFAIGGPMNGRTGRAYCHDSQAFRQWACEIGINADAILTPNEWHTLQRMDDAIQRHREASELLSDGWAELCACARLADLPCQARFDWLRHNHTVVDLKTTADIARFEADARRFGYLHQFAFYRQVAEAAGNQVEMAAVVVEKRPPYRVGVWRFPDAALAPYAAANLSALASLKRCRETRTWPTGYETARAFPPAGVPPVWLN